MLDAGIELDAVARAKDQFRTRINEADTPFEHEDNFLAVVPKAWSFITVDHRHIEKECFRARIELSARC